MAPVGFDPYGRSKPVGIGSPGGAVSRRIIIVLCLLAVAVPACGDEKATPGVIQAGQVDIKLPDGWTVTNAGAVRPKTEAAAAPGAPGAPAAAAGGPAAATGDT